MRILFIDDRIQEIVRQWQKSGCESDHELLPLEVFQSIEQAIEAVRRFEPDAVVIGFGLSHPDSNGADVIRALKAHGYQGLVIANSGGGVELFSMAKVEIDASADRDPRKLRQIL